MTTHPVMSTPSAAPSLAPGLTLLGEYQGSGFTEPHYLIVRDDQQVLHVSRLLYLVASALDGQRSVAEIADEVSSDYGRTLTPDGVEFLVEAKLRPMGIAAAAPAPVSEESPPVEPRSSQPFATPSVIQPASSTAPLPRADPLLAIRFRGTLVPPRATRFLARLLAPMFYGPTVVLALLSLVGADVWLLRTASMSDAYSSLVVDPPVLLSVVGILLAGTLFHELGHAAACRAGGARPGAIGVAVYIVYPVFFTDVTDSYRLGRVGRVRTDLGGVYFNALSIVGLTAIFAHTWSAAVLLAIVMVHAEMLQQLIPLGRLDGYFVVADLVGVPDLFSRIGPILGSLLPGRPAHPKVVELRRSARVVVTVWVLVTVPAMATLLGLMLWNAPTIALQTVDGIRREWTTLQTAVQVGPDLPSAALAVLSLLLLPLPLLGMTWLVGGALRRIALALLRLLQRHRPRPHQVGRTTQEITMSGSDPVLQPYRLPPSPLRAVPNGSSGPPPGAPPPVWPSLHGDGEAETVQPGPHSSPAEPVRFPRGRRGRQLRSDALMARVGTKFDGSRRIVVLSRKGGVGKTTTTLMLGHTLAAHRGDRVVALDANPDAGSLAMRLPRETAYSATDLLAERDWVQRYSQIRAFTSQDPVTRLEVVAADDDPRLSLALQREDYRRLIDTLDRHFTLLLADTGTGILDDAIQGILDEADQLVVVVPPALDGARVAAMTLDWLEEHGRESLAADSVAVVNGVRGASAQLSRVMTHFEARCASVHQVPWDSTLASSAHASLADLRPATRQAYLEVAGAVGAGLTASHRPLFGVGA